MYTNFTVPSYPTNAIYKCLLILLCQVQQMQSISGSTETLSPELISSAGYYSVRKKLNKRLEPINSY